jgi:hypothetical protein
MADEPITLRICYPVPLLWRDGGRERFGSEFAHLSFALRRVESVDLRGIEGSLPDDVRFEGRTWRALASAGSGTCDLAAVGRLLSVPNSFLNLELPSVLTTRVALSPDGGGGLPRRVARGTIERLDAEAALWARRFAEGELIYDGRAVRLAATAHKGVPESLADIPPHRLDAVGLLAVGILERTTRLAARDADVGRAAASLRRVALRGLVHAIPAEEFGDAVRAVERYAVLAGERSPRGGARDYALRAVEKIRSQVLPGLEALPPQRDIDDLAFLAP